MNLGGDAADQIVKYSMEGLEAGGKLAFDGADKILRLSGRGAQHLAAFFYAVCPAKLDHTCRCKSGHGNRQ